MTYDLIKSERDALDALMRIRVLCKKRRTCIQAGGLFGVWPAAFAQAFDVVLTFEAHPENYRQLWDNVKNIDAIVPCNAALGRESGHVGMCCDESDNPGAYYVAPGDEVEQIIIDDLCCDDLDLIYLDIEGAETDALLGATETIAKCRPVIGLEDKKNEFWRRFGYARSPVDMLVRDFNYVQVSHCNYDKIMIPAESA